jgi:hypothetical protein
MNYKKIILLSLSCFFILFFFKSNPNEKWLDERILILTSELQDHLDSMDIESRKNLRWGHAYTDGMSLKKHMDSIGVKNPLLLVPDAEYIKKHTPNAKIPEPIIFYYFTGIRTVEPSSKQARKATIALVINDKKFSLQNIAGKGQLDTILSIYN